MRSYRATFCLLAGVVLLQTFPGRPAAAQGTDEVEVLSAAFSYIRPQLPGGKLALDPTATSNPVRGENAAAFAQRVGAPLRAGTIQRACRTDASKGKATCSLGDADVVMTAHRPMIKDGDATALITWAYMEGESLTVEEVEVALTKKGRTWTVTKVLHHRIS